MAVLAPVDPFLHPAEAEAELARAESELAEARALLRRLLDAEDRIGLAYPVMDDARRFLARTRR